MKKLQVKRRPAPRKIKKNVSTVQVKKETSALLSIQSILVPVDFSEHSKKALYYAVSFAKKFKASITIIYVVEPMIFPTDFAIGQISFPNIGNELREKAEQELQTLINTTTLVEFKILTIVKDGIPFVEVTTYAKENGIDLIILAAHGHTGVEHILFGSTAEKIIRKSPCPVLVVRTDKQDSSDERV